MKTLNLDYQELIDYGSDRWNFVHEGRVPCRYSAYFVSSQDPLYPKIYTELSRILPKACQSSFRITKYEPGDFISSHNDMGPIGVQTKRRLTLVMQLSPGESYDGGDLVFEDGKKLSRDIGSYVVFPSTKFHEVLPVIRGTRYSLSWWIT